MPWQNVLISKPTKLSLVNGNLRVAQDGRELTLPMGDIATLTLESPQISLTAPVLSACAEHGIAVLVCDDKHLPNGVLIPCCAHSKAGEVALRQNAWEDRFCELAWAKLVDAKINNQISVLKAGGVSSARLQRIALDADVTHAGQREAHAARVYWPLLFGESFTRQSMTSISFALDYGYTVVRAAVARALSRYGFHCALGLHHKHPQNAFNLADDFIEPFRPFVDWWVRGDGTLDQSDVALTLVQRGRLQQALALEVVVERKTYSLQTAIDRAAQSLATATASGNAGELRLPSAPQCFRLSDSLPDG